MEPAILLAGAGAAYLYLSDDEAAPAPLPSPQVVGSRPVPVDQVVKARARLGNLFAAGEAGDRMTVHASEALDFVRSVLKPKKPTAQTGDGGGNWTKLSDTQAAAALAYTKAQLKKEYQATSAAVKKKGAAAINKELGTDLTGEESFEEASNKIGSAVGGVAGAAACTAVGVGAAVAPVCAILGAMAGAYLGKTIGPYLSKGWDYVEGFADDAWGKIEDAWDYVF